MTHAHKLDITTDGALKVNLPEYYASQETYDLGTYKQNGSTIPFQVYQTPTSELFNQEWLDYVQSKIPAKLQPWCMVFRRDEGPMYQRAHIDVAPYEDGPAAFHSGLNFTLLEDDDTEMVWYDRVDGIEFDMNDMQTYINVSYDSLKEKERAVIGKDNLVLVNTSTYHDVDNKEKERWCVSLRTSMDYDSWDDTVKAYQDLIV